MTRHDGGGLDVDQPAYRDLSFSAQRQQDEATFDLISWDDGERPSWWANPLAVWKFRTARGRVFTTNDLDDAVAELGDDERPGKLRSSVVRRALFLHAPKSVADRPVYIDKLSVTVELVVAAPYLKQQVAYLQALQKGLAELEDLTHRQVLQTAQAFAKRVVAEAAANGVAESDAFTREAIAPLWESDAWGMGLSASELQAWAKESKHYELLALCAAAMRHQREARQEELSAQAERQEEKARRREEAKAVQRFTTYFDLADFEPQNEGERYAHALHKLAASETEWEEKQNLLRQRDEAIADLLVRDTSTTAEPSVPEVLQLLKKHMTPERGRRP